MNGIISKLVLAATLVGMLCGALGCQDVHRENVQLAEARWSRARASVMLQLAEQQFKAGQLDKALLTAQQAGNLDPSFPRLWILRGQILAEKGQGQQAIAAFESAIVLDARASDAHYQCGVLYERWGQFDKALASYQSALDLNRDNVAYGVAVAETLGQLNRVTDGLAVIDRMLADQPQSVALRVTAGELWQVQGQYAKAAEQFREAARLATDDTDVIRSLALALHKAGQFELARVHLEQLLRQPASTAAADAATLADPTGKASGDVPSLPGERVELLLALGDCCLNTDRFDRASQAYTEVTRLLPNRAIGWEGLAKIAVRQGKWETAISSAERAGELEPGSVAAHLVRGYSLLQLSRPAEAIWSFQQANRLAPKDVLMLCMMADGYRRMGDSKSARQTLVRASQIAPADPLVSRMMDQLADAEFGKRRPRDAELTPPTVTASVKVEE